MALVRRREWLRSGTGSAARDMAVVGAASPVLGLLVFFGAGSPPVAWIAIAGIVGLLSGIAMGVLLERVRRWRLFTLPVTLLAGAPIVGTCWGALVGAGAALAANLLLHRRDHVPVGFCAGLGAIAAALQFGWIWFPWAWRRARRRSTWPVVALSVLSAPAIFPAFEVIGKAWRWLVGH